MTKSELIEDLEMTICDLTELNRTLKNATRINVEHDFNLIISNVKTIKQFLEKMSDQNYKGEANVNI